MIGGHSHWYCYIAILNRVSIFCTKGLFPPVVTQRLFCCGQTSELCFKRSESMRVHPLAPANLDLPLNGQCKSYFYMLQAPLGRKGGRATSVSKYNWEGFHHHITPKTPNLFPFYEAKWGKKSSVDVKHVYICQGASADLLLAFTVKNNECHYYFMLVVCDVWDIKSLNRSIFITGVNTRSYQRVITTRLGTLTIKNLEKVPRNWGAGYSLLILFHLMHIDPRISIG